MAGWHMGFVTLYDKQGEVAERFCREVCDIDKLKISATRKLKRKGYYSIMIEWSDWVYYKPGGFSYANWVRKHKKHFTLPFPGMKEE